MEITIDLSELRKRKILIATPMYGGMAHGLFTKSVADLSALCERYGIELKYFFLFNESLITRARNYCADEFMRSDFTHLMFIDADIGFDPNDVLTLAALMDPEQEDSKDIVCGPYPKKTIAWEKIKRAVDRGFADENPNDLERFVGDFVFNPTEDTSSISIDEPVKVLEGGTGFMMITRKAFDVFNKAYPDYAYIPDHIRTKHFDGSREIHMYFQSLIDPDTKRYLSEDYMFCQWMRKAGVDTWLCPWMKLDHTGSYTFGGSLADLAQAGLTATVDETAMKKRDR